MSNRRKVCCDRLLSGETDRQFFLFFFDGSDLTDQIKL